MLSISKTITKFIINFILNIFIPPSKQVHKNTLLLIRLDAIGDYVLFRNYIEQIRKSEMYKEYKITLIGNRTWIELSEQLDGNFVDEFIWLDRNKFNNNLKYRYTKLKEITSKGYDVVLSPCYSREYFYADTIVKLVNAKEKIGSAGDLSNIKKWQKRISNKYYTKLISQNYELMFEFDRNREFFENILEVKIDIKKPIIKLREKKLDLDLPQKYAILFIGASTSHRKWNMKGFAKVGRYLKDNYGYDIVLCGSPSDKDDAGRFKKYFKGQYTDLVGKTSLLDLLYIIHNANLMISNETSAPHFAVALDVSKIFVISNGNHFGRFTPYPKQICDHYHVVFHPQIEKMIDDHQALSNCYGFGSDLNIKEISSDQVIDKVNKFLKCDSKSS